MRAYYETVDRQKIDARGLVIVNNKFPRWNANVVAEQYVDARIKKGGGSRCAYIPPSAVLAE